MIDTTAGTPIDSPAADSTSPWSMIALLKGIWAKTAAPILAAGTAIIGKVGIDQTTPGTTDSVSVKGNSYVSAPTVTRPANVTPYTAGDVVGGAITFASVGPSGGSIYISSASLEMDIAALPSGMTTFRLYLYDATPPSALADNAPWDLSSGDRAKFLGYIDLGTLVDLGSTLYVQVAAATMTKTQFKLAAASTSLFGYLVSAAGYTPAANSEALVPKLNTLGV
jgi:hypothetical protein